MTATLYGVGVGPGDPELLTLKAWRLIQQADVISYITTLDGRSQAKHIAREALAATTHDYIELPVEMPMSKDRTLANQAYDKAAEQLGEQLALGKKVVFLCEGDPLFFGSFAYLLERLGSIADCEIVPGISSVHAAASALQRPLTLLKESFAVISGRHSDEHIQRTLEQHDSVVIMKAGMARPRILNLLNKTQRTQDAHYLEYISRNEEKIEHDVSVLAHEAGPYFSMFVVVRQRKQSLR